MHTPRASANGMNLPLPFQPKLVLIYRPRRDGRLSWPWVAGRLHTEKMVNQKSENATGANATNQIRSNGIPLHKITKLLCFPDIMFFVDLIFTVRLRNVQISKN